MATKTGWANADYSGIANFALKRDESSGMRLIKFRNFLTTAIEDEEINLVVFERTAGRFKSALIVQAELHGIMKGVCEDLGTNYLAYSATEIKKHATGKGNASKDMMVLAAREKWPSAIIIDDNHADALWLYDLAKTNWGI